MLLDSCCFLYYTRKRDRRKDTQRRVEKRAQAKHELLQPIRNIISGQDGSKVGELIGQLRWLTSMGIETVLGAVPQVDQIEPLEVIGREVIPAVADL